jgi:hypothetical protein
MNRQSRAAASPPTQDRASVSAIQFHIRKIAMARRAVRELIAIAEQRAARGRVASRRFRPLAGAEAEAIVGTDLLAQVAAAAGALK